MSTRLRGSDIPFKEDPNKRRGEIYFLADVERLHVRVGGVEGPKDDGVRVLSQCRVCHHVSETWTVAPI